jgi:hypothetical protein
LLVILLILLVLLSVPVDLAYRIHLRTGVEGRLTIGWLFGLIRIPVTLGGKKPGKKAKRKKAARRKSDRGRKIVTRGEFWRWLRRLLRKILGRIQVYRLFLRVRLGLGDPADTGRLWAFAGPVAAILATIPLADISIEPNFMDAELVLESEGQIRVYPISIIATVVVTALSPATWRVFRA